MAAAAAAAAGEAFPQAVEILKYATKTATFDPKEKMRYMEISIVNQDPNTYLLFEQEYFDVGRFWSQPFDKIEGGKSTTFYVVNGDMNPLGVSGGVGFGIYDANAKTQTKVSEEMFVCTFSHPGVGILKGKCNTAKTVEEVWNKMTDCALIRQDKFGLFKKEDRSLVFIWKPASKPW